MTQDLLEIIDNYDMIPEPLFDHQGHFRAIHQDSALGVCHAALRYILTDIRVHHTDPAAAMRQIERTAKGALQAVKDWAFPD